MINSTVAVSGCKVQGDRNQVKYFYQTQKNSQYNKFIEYIFSIQQMIKWRSKSAHSVNFSSSTEYLRTLILHSYRLWRSELLKDSMLSSWLSFWVRSASFNASLPRRLFLQLRMSLKLATLFLECPEGNITKPESYFLPPLRVMLIEVGMPSGYFSSYCLPPWVKVHLAMSSLVFPLNKAVCPQSLGSNINVFQTQSKLVRVDSLLLNDLSSKALRKIVLTIQTMEWSADCLVDGVFLAGSPIIPKAGSYATMLMFSISSILWFWVNFESKTIFWSPSRAPAD